MLNTWKDFVIFQYMVFFTIVYLFSMIFTINQYGIIQTFGTYLFLDIDTWLLYNEQPKTMIEGVIKISFFILLSLIKYIGYFVVNKNVYVTYENQSKKTPIFVNIIFCVAFTFLDGIFIHDMLEQPVFYTI